MKQIIIWGLIILTLTGCNNSPQSVSQQNSSNTNTQNAANSLVVSSHSTTNETAPSQNPTIVPKSDTKTKWTQSGEPIDVSAFNAEIAKAEKDLKVKPKDETAKKTLADAYVKRADALTQARQYASALGDYRRALKYDATNEDAKSWIEQITNIYQSMNREAPKDGEEPPPLPFTK